VGKSVDRPEETMKRALLIPVAAIAGLLGCDSEVTQGQHGGMGGASDLGGATGTGTGGATGLGGATGTGGAATGTAGNTGSGAAGSTGSAGATGMGGQAVGGSSGAGGAVTDDTAQIKADLEGAAKWTLPCGVDQSYSLLVCQNNPPTGNCRLPSATVPYLTAGTINLDKTITLHGTVGRTYTVTARIQGVVEPKHYQNGVNTTATTCAAAPATNTNCGWYVGGAPQTVGNYNVYSMWVSAPAPTPTTGLPGQYYFLNNINKTEAHFSYPMDYTVTFQVNGGAMVRFLADDSNCSAIKNCDTTSVDTVPGGGGRCNPITINGLVSTPAPGTITQPYSGQFVVLSVLSVK
jgi:hypothetical protein